MYQYCTNDHAKHTCITAESCEHSASLPENVRQVFQIEGVGRGVKPIWNVIKGINAKSEILTRKRKVKGRGRERKRKGKKEEGKGWKGNWKWSFGRNGKNRKRPSRESNPGPGFDSRVQFPGSIPGWGVCDFFPFLPKLHFQFPFHPFPSSFFPFLFLSLPLPSIYLKCIPFRKKLRTYGMLPESYPKVLTNLAVPRKCSTS